jgi:hypothetical protein
MATDEEIAQFRKDYAHEISRHDQVVRLMKRHNVQSVRTETPYGAHDAACPNPRLGYDSFVPRPPAGGPDPRPASDRTGRRTARDQQPPPAHKPMLLDADPEAVKARLEKVLGPRGPRRPAASAQRERRAQRQRQPRQRS